MGTALALRYELKVATRLGEVIGIAACWADAVVGIVTSTSYVKDDRRVAVHLISSTCHQNSARTTIDLIIDSMQALTLISPMIASAQVKRNASVAGWVQRQQSASMDASKPSTTLPVELYSVVL